VRKLAKMKEDDELILFTTKEILQREEELLAYDNLNFDHQQWQDSSTDDEDEESDK
jgi:CPA2 family monovalent cation:H+ antiporter-2